jgi:small-conductance mechanosensitive channel
MSKWSETVDKVGDLLNKSVVTFGEETIHVYDFFIAFFIIVSTYFVLRWVRRLLAAGQKATKLTIGQQFAYYQLAKYIIVVIALVSILKTFKVDLNLLIIGSTGVLVALALGLQHLFNDLVSGFFLLFEGTIRVGDIIEVEGMVCRVQEIGIRTSKVKKRDGISLVIPNGKIISNSVINWTTDSSITRFTVKVGVAYGSDVQLVRGVLLECAERHNEVVRSPKPICRFIDFGDSSLNFELLFWSKNRFRIEDVQSDLRFMINSEFTKNNIRIPFPQRDIHIIPKQEPPEFEETVG